MNKMNGTENINNNPSEQNKDPETNIDREHERILNEIETTDTAFIGASLRYSLKFLTLFNTYYLNNNMSKKSILNFWITFKKKS